MLAPVELSLSVVVVLIFSAVEIRGGAGDCPWTCLGLAPVVVNADGGARRCCANLSVSAVNACR